MEIEGPSFYMDGWVVVLPDERLLECADAPRCQFESKAKAELAASLIPGARVEVLHTINTGSAKLLVGGWPDEAPNA